MLRGARALVHAPARPRKRGDAALGLQAAVLDRRAYARRKFGFRRRNSRDTRSQCFPGRLWGREKNARGCRIRSEPFVVGVSSRRAAAHELAPTPRIQEMIEMQYLVSVIANGSELPTAGEDAAIDAFNDRLRAQGYWVFGNGLAEPSAATVVDGRGEAAVLTDGPFLESKEFLAGFWIIEAP